MEYPPDQNPDEPPIPYKNSARRLTWTFVLMWFLWAIWLSYTTMPPEGSLTLLIYKVITVMIWVGGPICAVWNFVTYLRNEFYRMTNPGRRAPPPSLMPSRTIRTVQIRRPAPEEPRPQDYFLTFGDDEFTRRRRDPVDALRKSQTQRRKDTQTR